MEVPTQGHMLYAFDPTGAAFGVWQPGANRGAQVTDEPGAMCWAEVHTRDGEAADTFYRGLFGYEQEQIGDPTRGFDYTTWKLGGRPVCGRMLMGSDFPPDLPAQWMPYFAVHDADAASRAVGELGGRVLMGAFDSEFGRMALVADPAGAVFTVMAPNPGTTP